MHAFVVVPLALVLASVAGFWWATRRERSALKRWSLRLAAVPVGYLALHAWLAGLQPALDSGTWFCRICARCEERLEWLGLALVRRDSAPEDVDERTALPYRAWFDRGIALDHEHDWIPSGCHGGFSVTRCSPRWAETPFFVLLPRLPDPDAARALVTRLASSPVTSRRDLLDAFHCCEELSSPFTEILDGVELSRPEFDAAYQDWLARHPEWR